MRGAKAKARVTMEVFVKEDEIFEVGVGFVERIVTMARAATILYTSDIFVSLEVRFRVTREENAGRSKSKIFSDILKVAKGA